MAKAQDKQIIEWGSRLFHPLPKRTKQVEKVSFRSGGVTASEIRNRVREVVRPHAKQVLVKITGGGRGMAPIAAHFRYISRQGKPEVGGRGQSLELEDQDGNKISGAGEVKELQEDWRVSGSYIEESSNRREAFNIVLSMPEGTPPEHVLSAAREFAREHFAGHKYVFVMHNDTDSPHVHLAVKAERKDGRRLNPRPNDLQQWRESFAKKLQDRGIDAVTTRAATRNQTRAQQAIWRLKAGDKVRAPRPAERSGQAAVESRAEALYAWRSLERVLAASTDRGDQALSRDVSGFVARTFEGVTPALRPAPEISPLQAPQPRR